MENSAAHHTYETPIRLYAATSCACGLLFYRCDRLGLWEAGATQQNPDYLTMEVN